MFKIAHLRQMQLLGFRLRELQGNRSQQGSSSTRTARKTPLVVSNVAQTVSS
jgi:hypothetical protein